MKFTIASMFAFMAFALAAPTVDIVEKRQTDNAAAIQAAQANKCQQSQAGANLQCCSNQQKASPGQIQATGGGSLLDLLTGLLGGGAQVPIGINCTPLINVLGIPINLPVCKQTPVCCVGAPVKAQTQNVNGGLQLFNINGDVIPINNLCLGSLLF